MMESTKQTICQMTADHVAQVAQIERLCFRDPWSENSVAGELTNKLAHWIVLEEDGRVLGYVGTQTVMDETDMMNIAVHPDHRRKGIADALMAALISDLERMGSHSLTLEVRVSNEPARKLYERWGFAEVGRRKNYYRNPREDALILRREIVA